MHKRRRLLFSRNIRNIMAMAIQYTSNGLSTDLVVHQLIFSQFSSCTCIDSSPQIFISRLFSPIRHFNSMETSSTHAQLLSYPDRPQSSRAVLGSPVIATVLARHGFDRVYTSNFNRTIPCRAVAYRTGTEKLCRVNGVLHCLLELEVHVFLEQKYTCSLVVMLLVHVQTPVFHMGISGGDAVG